MRVGWLLLGGVAAIPILAWSGAATSGPERPIAWEMDHGGHSLAFGGGVYLYAFTATNGAVEAVRIRPSDQAVLDDPPLLIAVQGSVPSAASDGEEFLVAWNAGPKGHLYAARVRASDGLVLDPAGFVVSNSGPPDDCGGEPVDGGEVNPTVSFNGSTFLVAWEQQRNCSRFGYGRATHVTTDARVVEPAGFNIPLGAPGRSTGGNGFSMVAGDQVAVARIAGVGSASAVSTFSESDVASGDLGAAIAGNGDGFLFAWICNHLCAGTHGTAMVFTATFDRNGELVGHDRPSVKGQPWLDDLAWDGASYAITWVDATRWAEGHLDLAQGHFDPEGAPLDEARLIDPDVGFADLTMAGTAGQVLTAFARGHQAVGIETRESGEPSPTPTPSGTPTPTGTGTPVGSPTPTPPASPSPTPGAPGHGGGLCTVGGGSAGLADLLALALGLGLLRAARPRRCQR